mmetsp:Transcript_20517/g.56874  ORF Transcript_20517/g.56874 Transcript_20517/m.56874 type:complete len:412 (+) Transcript_20517:106-1341(+)
MGFRGQTVPGFAALCGAGSDFSRSPPRPPCACMLTPRVVLSFCCLVVLASALSPPRVANPGVLPGEQAAGARTGRRIVLRQGREGGRLPRLVFVPQCGLGDRLLVISRAVDLSRRLENGQVHVNWYPADNIALPALSLAFDTSTIPPPLLPTKLRNWTVPRVYGSCLPAAHCVHKIRTLFPGPAQASPGAQLQRPHAYLTPSNANRAVSIFVECAYGDATLYSRAENFPRLSQGLHDLAPSRAVLEAVLQVETAMELGPSGAIGGEGASRVGLHIRGKDKVSCLGDDTMAQIWEALLGLLVEAVRESPATVFFLSTDEAAVADRLERELVQELAGANVASQAAGALIRTRLSVQRSRSSQAGMLDAVVDWFLLAGSRSIIGNVQSSFGYSASARNGLRYTVAYPHTRLCNM